MQRDKKINELKNKALSLPQTPGVYIMRNKYGEIIYIGKAKKLKNRVVQYFRNIHSHLPKVYQMVIRVNDFEHILCDSEFEALVLECNLIKMHTPKYNILLKDDKGYHYIKISGGDYPKISAAKQSDVNSCRDGSKFIGPYMSAFVVKQTVNDANKIFSLPTCSRSFPRDFGKKRPCLQHHLGLCSAVCSGKISKEAYQNNLSDAVDYINGNGNINIKQLEEKMMAASENLDFELAASLRDRIRAAQKINDEQKIILDMKNDCDFIAASFGEQKCCFCTLRYKKGKLYDSSQHIFDITSSFEEMFSQFLVQYYMQNEYIPHEILINTEISDKQSLEQLLTEKSGRKAQIFVPQKSEKKRLVLLAQNNAAEGLSKHIDIGSKEIAALDEVARLLSLDSVPNYIESYDISNLGDKYMVGTMVVFENGKPLKSAYKKFTIKEQFMQDDYSAMSEVLRRRFTEYLNSDDHTSGFGRLPDLILLDGGKGHVSVVKKVLEELNICVPLFGMVKDSHHRTRAVTGEKEISISKNRTAFTFISKIQDEVHRYSISFQRTKHMKSSVNLSLTQIEGIGKAKAAALLKHFKTLKAIKEASIEELCAVKGITLTLANRIADTLSPKMDYATPDKNADANFGTVNDYILDYTFKNKVYEKEFHIRDGLYNTLYKLQNGMDVKVAYIGGSITQMDTWRTYTTKYLREKYTSNITEIEIGLAGTNADLAVCRIDKEILIHKPDLIFIEYAVNGGSAKDMEGMVLKTYKQSPQTDICFVYTTLTDNYPLYAEGKVQRYAEIYEEVAKYYGIPTVFFGNQAFDMYEKGILTLSASKKEDGKVLYTTDTTHLTADGGFLSAGAIARCIVNMEKGFNKENYTLKDHIIPGKTYDDFPWVEADFSADWDKMKFEGEWFDCVLQDDNNFKNYEYTGGYVWKFKQLFKTMRGTKTAGSSVTVKFKGTDIGVFEAGGQQSGQLKVIVDGKELDKKLVLYNKYYDSKPRHQYYFIDSLPYGEHTVTFILDSEMPDKSALKNQNPDDNLYDRNEFYLGRILLNGKILNAND